MKNNRLDSVGSFSLPVPSQTWWILCLSMVVVFFLVTGRVIWLQGVSGAQWAMAADRNRTVRVVQYAPRGRILDRYGITVADNRVVYVEQYRDGAYIQERSVPVEQAVELIATDAGKVRRTYAREYPFGPVLAHIVGYVLPPQRADDVVKGQTGVEWVENGTLAGTNGFVLYERDARGRAVRKLEQREPEKGSDLTLTIDAELSRVALEALGTQRGAVVVSIPETGEVLAAVSSPSFLPYPQDQEGRAEHDPFVQKGVAAKSLADGLQFPHSPFLFRPTQAQYPPGSIFKIVTAMAGLERKVITQENTVRDEGELKVGEFTYQNWYWRQFGRVEGEVNVVRALARSNDIFFYTLAEWIGPQALADFARLFSLGKATGFPLPGEKPGLVPDPVWKQRVLGEKWFLGNTYHMGIGQGDVLVTPLQLQGVMASVAARGRKCAPRLLQQAPISCEELSLQPDSLGVVVKGLRQACAPGGTAYPFFTSSYDVMCKTGTAEFGAEDSEGHRPTHGWLSVAVSSEERKSPETTEFSADIVITVLVESDEEQLYKEGSRDAAPVAKTIADWWWMHRSKSEVLIAE